MGKSKAPILESSLLLPVHPSLADPLPENILVDTHTHILSTFEAYREKYPNAEHDTVQSFIKHFLLSSSTNRVSSLVDVWCEAPISPSFHSVVNSLSELKSEGLDYRFVIGCHPNVAQDFTEGYAEELLRAYRHDRCVGWGEIGLDYHVHGLKYQGQQKKILRRQLDIFLEENLDKALTIHTREADEDIFTILTEKLPRETRIHLHCFTDSPELAEKLCDHFPNLFVGITGVITYSSNQNTSQVVRLLARKATPSNPSSLRILLETDGPYMVPSNLTPPALFGLKSGQKLPFAHPGMSIWTAEWIKDLLNESKNDEAKGEAMNGDAPVEESCAEAAEREKWTIQDVLQLTRENAKTVYKI